MKEHANIPPTGFRNIADYLIVGDEIFFAPSIFLESKSQEVIDLSLDKLIDYLIKVRVGESAACQIFKALVIGWNDSFLFQEKLNGYVIELISFSDSGCVCNRVTLTISTLDESKKALKLNVETTNGELPDRPVIS